MSWPMTNARKAELLTDKIIEALTNQETGDTIARTLRKIFEGTEDFLGAQKNLREYVAKVITQELESISQKEKGSGVSGL